MSMPDQHMHTNFSPDADATATFESYIEQAELQGISSLTFTDHVDLDTPVSLFQIIPDYYAYRTRLNQLQKNTNVTLNMGVEIGYQPHLNEAYDTFLNAHNFDFIIMSIHVGDGLDFYNGDFFKEKTQEKAFQRYFEIVLNAVKNYDHYDVVGHLDYIIRYALETNDYDFKAYQPMIDEILNIIIEKQKGIELNMSGLRYGLKHTHPKLDLIKRYQALGGEIITLGSDAHHPKDYRADFDQGIALLKTAGFDKITVFKQRKKHFITI